TFIDTCVHEWTDLNENSKVLNLTFSTNGDIRRSTVRPRNRLRNINWVPALQSLRRLKMKLIRRENQFMIKGSGWTAGAKQIAARLHQWRSLHLVAEWSSLTSTGRAAPYLSSSHLMKDLLFSPPSLVSLRCHLLPCGANRRQGRRQCTLCGELESQTHILGGCPSRMSMFTLRHNEIRSKLSKFLRDNLQSCSIVEER
ncbi:hypothetical protein ADUPG1_004535, partial [Aduncisulcus paluster]